MQTNVNQQWYEQGPWKTLPYMWADQIDWHHFICNRKYFLFRQRLNALSLCNTYKNELFKKIKYSQLSDFLVVKKQYS